MRSVLVAVVIGVCAFVGGCQPGASSGGYTEKQLETMESLAPQLSAYLQGLLQFRYIGIAEIRMRPSGGRLYIDGGEYVGDEKEIPLPVGAYEFTAVWGDGRQATRKIFVEAALGGGSVNMDWKDADGQLNWEIDHDVAMTKTPVELVRP